MTDGNAKSDLEHASERAVRASTKGTGILARFITKATIRARKYYQKHFSSSLRALKKDGATKELAVSSPLTRAEAKELITNARENGILVGVKKMQPDGDEGKNQSLHQQEKLAKNEIKYEKWNERRKVLKNVPVLNKISKKQADKFRERSKEDNLKYPDERYIILCNKSHLAFFNEQLELLEKKRTQRTVSDDLKEITDNGMISKDDKIVSRDINISPEQLEVGTDYGSCFVKDYNKNFCLQKISKLEYCEIRELLFELKSHGAKVMPNGDVMVAINSDDLEEYKKFAPLDKSIKEYGEYGGKQIESESNNNNIINVKIGDDLNKTQEQIKMEYLKFKEQYKNKDYFIVHTPDGIKTACVREKDTKEMADEVKKKSSTADLLKEANEFAEEKEQVIENVPSIELEEEQVIDR